MEFLADKKFRAAVLAIAIPSSLQNLLGYGVQFVDTLMLGFLGEVEMTAVAQGNQMYIIFSSLVAGLAGGGAILISQYWGKRDVDTISRIMSMMFRTVIVISVIYSGAIVLFPTFFMGLLSNDPKVIETGAQYLQIVAPTYLLYAVSFVYMASNRAVEEARMILVINGISYTVNIALNAILIFGLFGFPKLGIIGAAVGTVVARLVEIAIVLLHMYRYEYKINFRFRKLMAKGTGLWRAYLNVAPPVACSDMMWGISATVQSVVLGNISTSAVAANNIAHVTFQCVSVIFMGVCYAAAVLIGKAIGQGRLQYVQRMANMFLKSGLIFGAFMCAVMFGLSFVVPFIYPGIMGETVQLAQQIMWVRSVEMIGYAMECITVVGILRGGGAAWFSFTTVLICWAASLVLGTVAAFVWNLPVPMVVFVIRSSIILMAVACSLKVKGGKWINNFTHQGEPAINPQGTD